MSKPNEKDVAPTPQTPDVQLTYAELSQRRRENTAHIPTVEAAIQETANSLHSINAREAQRRNECLNERVSALVDPELKRIIQEKHRLLEQAEALQAELKARHELENNCKHSLHARDALRDEEAERWLKQKYKSADIKAVTRNAQKAINELVRVSAYSKDTCRPETHLQDLMNFLRGRLDLDDLHKQMIASIAKDRADARDAVVRADPTLG